MASKLTYVLNIRSTCMAKLPRLIINKNLEWLCCQNYCSSRYISTPQVAIYDVMCGRVTSTHVRITLLWLYHLYLFKKIKENTKCLRNHHMYKGYPRVGNGFKLFIVVKKYFKNIFPRYFQIFYIFFVPQPPPWRPAEGGIRYCANPGDNPLKD